MNSVSPKIKVLVNTLSRAPENGSFGRFVWLAWAGWVIVLLLVAGLFLASLPYAVSDVKYVEWEVRQAQPAAINLFATYDAFVIYLVVLRLAAVIIFWGTAVYIVWRKPREWMVLYVSATLLMMSYLFAFQSDIDRWRFPLELLSFLPALEWLTPLLFATCFFLLFYLFPDGRFVPKWIGGLGAAAAGISVLFFTTFENTIGLSEEMGWITLIISVLLFAVVGLFSQVVKWRKASHVQKQQTRLILFALGGFVALPLLQPFVSLLIGEDPWLHFFSLHLFLMAATLIPITVGISALRYRLWQMDVLLIRTLVYVSITTVILLLCVGIAGLLGVYFGREGNMLLAVLVTGFVVVFFNPLRQRLQRLVNQLLYGQRDDPFAVIEALGRQLADTTVPSQMLPALVQTIAQTLKLPFVAIVGNKNDILVASTEKQAATCYSFPLIYQTHTVGQLQIAPREVGEVFSPEEEKLLRNIAQQAGTAVYAAQLTDQLQQSREQLVITREEERRRLRRDLHDGLGPQLAALAIKAGAAQNMLRSDPEKAERLLGEINIESQKAIKEVRQVVEGLRPSSLDQLGLLSALRELIAQQDNGQVRLCLHAPHELPNLPAATEVAVYRIVTEAITNVLRHAHAQSCQVHLTVGERVNLSIVDDGIGFALTRPKGIGLLSMRERAEELGGSFEVVSHTGGTRVTALLPLIS